MTMAADSNQEPLVDIDNLWYFNSVVSSKPSSFKTPKPSKRSARAALKNQTPAAGDDQDNPPADVPDSQVSQLPLSTGGGSAALSGYNYSDPGTDGEAALGKRCASCQRGEGERPCMCDLVKKMEKGVGELPPAELDLWMEKLGLEYTEDKTMIRRIPNTNFGSQQKLDFSEFVCLNRFIEEERNSPRHAKQHTLFEVFQLFDKDGTGLISPSDLCAALAQLGLRGSS